MQRKQQIPELLLLSALALSNKDLLFGLQKRKVRGYGALLGNRAEFTNIFDTWAQIKPTQSVLYLLVSVHRLQALKKAPPPGDAKHRS